MRQAIARAESCASRSRELRAKITVSLSCNGWPSRLTRYTNAAS